MVRSHLGLPSASVSIHSQVRQSVSEPPELEVPEKNWQRSQGKGSKRRLTRSALVSWVLSMACGRSLLTAPVLGVQGFAIFAAASGDVSRGEAALLARH